MDTLSKHRSAGRPPGISGQRRAEGSDNLAHVEFEIRKQTQGSLFMAAMLLFLTPYITGPAGIYFARRALAGIAKYGVGQRYEGMAKAGLWIGIVVTTISFGLAAILAIGLAVYLGMGALRGGT